MMRSRRGYESVSSTEELAQLVEPLCQRCTRSLGAFDEIALRKRNERERKTELTKIIVQLVILVPVLLWVFYVSMKDHNTDGVRVETLAKLRETVFGSTATAEYETSFVVIGDWGRQGYYGQGSVAKAMSTVISDTGINVDFVISSGDNFYSTGVESVHDHQWMSSFEDVYKGESFDRLRWYATLGNHDHMGNVNAQVEYSKLSDRWHLPARYYSFVVPMGKKASASKHTTKVDTDTLFIMLDSTPYIQDHYGDAARKVLGSDSATHQTEWLHALLEDDTQPRRIVVVVHHNMYTMSTAGHLGAGELRQTIEPVLLRHRHRIVAIISGHEHSLMHMQPYGNSASWSGAAADTPDETCSKTTNSGTKLCTNAYNNGTIDYFISGGGSKLDDLDEPAQGQEEKWRRCCGVLSRQTGAFPGPHARWGLAKHGFFVFTLTDASFRAVAFDRDAEPLYTYSKAVGGGVQ